jgi:uncharacterized protein
MKHSEKPLDKKIISFISEHHVLTIATTNNSIPWCAHCFYTFDVENLCFYIATDLNTRHAQEAIKQAVVSGGIMLETKTVGKIRGLQFSGVMEIPQGQAATNAKKKYLQAFPFAILTKTTIWIIKLTYAKYTDNRLGFGTKLIWE